MTCNENNTTDVQNVLSTGRIPGRGSPKTNALEIEKTRGCCDIILMMFSVTAGRVHFWVDLVES